MSRRARLILFIILIGMVLAFSWSLPLLVNQFNEMAVVAIGRGSFRTATATNSPSPSPNPDAVTEELPSPSPAPERLAVARNNCTLDIAYWTRRTEAWPFDVLTIGDLQLSKEEAVEVLTSSSVQVQDILLRQMITYVLNTFVGADPSEVLETVAAARHWLSVHPPGSEPPEAELELGLNLARHLQEFNAGILGPGACLVLPDTATPTATATPSASATSTTTSTPSVTPSRTVAPPLPTATPTEQKPNPGPTAPPPPTATLPPPPTAPPTQPAPTPIPVPPSPTSVPTEEPPPTPAP